VPVYDISAGAIVGEVRDVPGVHGVLAVPELGRVYATATGTNQVAVIDPQSLSVVATIPGGTYPDGLAYDPEVGKLYISDESGGTDTVIDTASNQVVATVPLGGDAGNTQFDPGSHQILAAVQSRNQVVTIDPQTDQVTGRYDTPGCDGPHGLQISPDRRLAFVACEDNAKLVVMDLQSMSVTESHDVLRSFARLESSNVWACSHPIPARKPHRFRTVGVRKTRYAVLSERSIGEDGKQLEVDHRCEYRELSRPTRRQAKACATAAATAARCTQVGTVASAAPCASACSTAGCPAAASCSQTLT